MAAKVKYGIISLLILVGIVTVGVLFSKDILAKNSAKKAVVTTAAVASPDVLGIYGKQQLKRDELTGSERQRLFEAEMQLYRTVEDILAQRYVTSFFETYREQKKLPDAKTAEAAYLAERVKVADADVKRLLEQNKENPNLQRIPESEREGQIRKFLEERMRSSVLRQVADDGKQRGELEVSAPRPSEPKVEVNDGGNVALGASGAKVTVIEFADYQCPFCSRSLPVRAEIMKKYNGKVRWVFRDFPLREIHPEALPAAIAANCAGAQGKYYEANTFLFENQSQLGIGLYKQAPQKLGINDKQFEVCLKDPAQEAEVLKDMDAGVAAGVNGTPAYFINGKKLGGAVDLAEFSRLIDEELK